MRLKLYLESGSTEHEGGRSLIWVLALPGCVSYGEAPEQAISRAPQVAQAYIDWLRSHGEAVPIPIELEHEPSEVFHVSILEDYEINAIFSPDFGAPSAEELARCLRWMDYSRQDLLRLVRDLPAQLLDEKPDPNRWSIREILHHVARAEVWYITRLSSDPSQTARPAYPQETFALLQTTRAWAIQQLQYLPSDVGKQIFTLAGEVWTLKKVLRRFLYHEAYHRQQIERLIGGLRYA